jgi:DNA-binding transcriptional LysR family regulator
MRLDQFSGIVAFVKVAETRSFTRAAAELGVAPASLSEAVKGLEERLGVRLLNRTTRSVGLTEAGVYYLDHVRPAAEEVWAAGAALRETAIAPPARCA